MKRSSSSSRSRTAFENNNYSGKNFLSLRDDVEDEDDDDEMTMMSMAAILLQLKNQDLEYGLPCSWGRKRRRSAIDLTPPSSPLALPPPEESPRGSADDGGGLEDKESVSLAQEINKEKKAASPSTPLSFSPSESDEKSATIILKPPTPSSKIFTKKRKEELLREVSKLTETRDTLEREIEIVRKYYEEQRTLNLKLKAKKIKLSMCDDKERASDMEMKNNNLNLDIQLAQEVKIPSATAFFHGQFQPLITDLRLHPTAAGVAGASCGELQYHIGLGMRRGLHDRLPDLNLTIDEARDVDYFPPVDEMPRGAFFLSTDWCRALSAEGIARAQAAEARKNRMQICKVKIKNAAAKSRQGPR